MLSVVTSRTSDRAAQWAGARFPPQRRRAMDSHHHHNHQESNLKDGLLGIAIALVGMGIIMAIAYFMALG